MKRSYPNRAATTLHLPLPGATAGIVALVLWFFTEGLRDVPIAALGAVVIAASLSLRIGSKTT